MASSGKPQDVWKSSAAARPAAARRAPARGRWFAAALAVVGLAGVVAGLLFYLWPDPAPVILTIPVAAYTHPDCPPNPWAESDARGFLERAPEGGAQTFQAQEKQAILRELDRVVADGRRRPLVVYLSMLGVVSNGKVQLLPADARPDETASWLPLEEILSRLRRVSTPRLLILDIRPALDSRIGLSGEDVNERLDAALAGLSESGDLPFLVLTANTPPSGTNVLRALKRTAFGLAIAHGAGGAADGWNPDRGRDGRDGRVSARELAAYTRELTHHISTTAGLPAQAPRLHGTGGDVDLFTIPPSGPASLPSLAEPEREPEWLQQAWKDRDEWVKEELHLRAPRVFRHFTLTAARAERRWLAGGNPEAIQSTFNVAASRLREIRPTLGPIVQPVGTVARARQKPGVNVAAATAALQGVFNRLSDPAPKETDKEPDKAVFEAMRAVWDKPPEGEPFDAVATAVFNFARNQLDKPTHRHMKLLATLLKGFKPRAPRHAELAAITLIGGLPTQQVEKWPGGTIALVLTVARDAEEAAAIDGRAFPWVRSTLSRADAARRAALRDLCDPKSTYAIREAAVVGLEAAGKDYRDVRTAADALASAYREYEETRAVLVDLAVSYPFDALPLAEEVGRSWDVLADDFGKLQLALTAPPAPALPNGGALERLTQSVRADRQGLLRSLQLADSASVRQYENLLRWPHWSRPERDRVLARLDQADRAAAQRVLDSWPKEPPNRDTPTPQRGAERAGVLGGLRRSVALLRLVDAPGAGDLKAELDRLGAAPVPAAVAEIAVRVRYAARQKLAEVYGGADPARQALLGWVVDPDDAPAYPESGSAGPPNPELPERRNAEKAFHDWLAKERYTAEAAFYNTIDLPAARDAAGDYRELARAYADAFR
jgi:hypothetical protein